MGTTSDRFLSGSATGSFSTCPTTGSPVPSPTGTGTGGSGSFWNQNQRNHSTSSTPSPITHPHPEGPIMSSPIEEIRRRPCPGGVIDEIHRGACGAHDELGDEPRPDGAYAERLVRERDEARAQVDSLEAQIHEDGGFISRMVDADAEVERLREHYRDRLADVQAEYLKAGTYWDTQRERLNAAIDRARMERAQAEDAETALRSGIERIGMIAASGATSERARGDGDRERHWLDLLAVIERIAQPSMPSSATGDVAGTVEAWKDRHGDIWRLGDDGLMHSFETAPFSREHVEKKWGPLVAAKQIGGAS